MSHVAEPRTIIGSGTNPIGPASGDLTAFYPNPTVIKINGAIVPASGTLTTGNVLQVNGAASLTYAPVNLAGGSSYITGLLPTNNQVPQVMGGDISGTTANSTVIKIQNYNVGNIAPNDGYVLTWISGNNQWEPKPGVLQQLSYGELDTVNGTGTQTLVLPDTFYKITQFNEASLASGVFC